ncbi:MAG: ATP-dependent zinc protease [Planctomycetaceae bacterium]
MTTSTDQNSTDSQLKTVGWREWLELPDLGIPHIKAKIDTGAQTSSLHATEVETFDRDGCTCVRFTTVPLQNDPHTVQCEAELRGLRSVRSSDGQSSQRPVIVTTIQLFGESHRVEVTLADRTRMGFPMLLGRTALEDRFLVHAGRSFLSGIPEEFNGMSTRDEPEDACDTD